MYCEYTSVRNSYNSGDDRNVYKRLPKANNGWPSSNFNKAFLSDK
jgi:hypothetical protein